MNTSRAALILAGIVSLVISPGCGKPAVLPSHQFSLRLADYVEHGGMLPSVMRSSGDQVFLDSVDIVVGSDFERIWTTDARGRPAISFSVNKAAAQKLAAITGSNSGKMIALVVNGVPESAIPISSPFSDSFQVNGDFSETEIRQFYTAVTGYDR